MTRLEELRVSRRQALHSVGGALLAGGLVSGLAACGGGDGGSSSTTVTVWFNRPENRRAMEDLLAAFKRDHPDIAVDVAYKPTAEYPAVLKTALVGGAGPDAIVTNGANGIWGDTGADGGYIVPLDGRLDLSPLQPSVQRAITYRGHVYGAPVSTFRVGVFYQRELFDKHGLSEPTTWDELLATSRALSDAGDVAAWAMPAQDMILPFFFYHLAVNSILGDDSVEALTSGRRKLTDPDLVRAAQLMIDASQYFAEGYQAVAYAEGKALFAQGRAAMIVGGSSDYAGYTQINPQLDAGFFGFPSPDGSQAPTVLNGLSMAYTVNKKASDRDATTTFVTWLASRPAQQIVLDQLGLPSIDGLTPSGSDTRSAMLRTILGVDASPSWLDFPTTGGTIVAVQRAPQLFTGKLTAEQFAAQVQRAIVVAPA